MSSKNNWCKVFIFMVCFLFMSGQNVSAGTAYPAGQTGGAVFTISNVSAARVGLASATVKWDTSNPTTSQVEFRKKGDRYYSLSEKDKTLKTSNHVIVVQGLHPSVDYEFHVIGVDANNKKGLSVPNNTLKTKPSYPVPSSSLIQASGSRLSIVGNPNFSYSSLTPEMKLWYDRTVESMAAAKADIEYNAKSSNLYRYREVNKYVSSMLMALRATGDLRFLDEAIRIMEFPRSSLKDALEAPDPNMPGASKCTGARDGYLNWIYLEFYPKTGYNYSEIYFGNDNIPLDECMAHGYVAAFAYALQMNRHLNPIYAEKADFWIDYLENHFLSKWYERSKGQAKAWSPEEQGGVVKRFTHPVANVVRLAYYLYKITGNTFYLERANYYCSLLVNNVTVNTANPAAFVWKHQVWGSDTGYQEINYAQYFMTMVQEMSIEGFGNYYPDSAMQKYAGTFEGVLAKYGSPWSAMAANVNAVGQTSLIMYNLSGFAHWDTKGVLMNISRATYKPGQWYASAFALGSVSSR